MIKLVGLITNKVYAEAENKRDLLRKANDKYKTSSKSYPLKSGHAVYPEPLKIEGVYKK